MSSLSLARRPNPRLRTHAVSILDGDYDDDHDHEGRGFTSEEDEAGWEVSPAEAKTNEEDDDAEGEFDREESEHDSRVQAEVLEQQRAYDEKKKKWIENAKPHVRVREIDDRGRAYGRGSRKEAVARVWIFPGEGFVTVNNKDIVDYFPREFHREHLLSPFVASRTCGKFDVRCHVEGGGLSGKAGAIRHGLARALEKYNPDYRPPMKRLGFMTRDPRMVERKKIGKKKARKSPQWVRR